MASHHKRDRCRRHIAPAMSSRILAIAILTACGPGARPGPDADCPNGDCEYTCDHAVADHGYVGCDYWPVDLDNAIEVLEPATNNVCRIGKNLTMDVCWDGTSHGLCDRGGICPAGMTCESHAVCVL